jgi:hypothetical protein
MQGKGSNLRVNFERARNYNQRLKRQNWVTRGRNPSKAEPSRGEGESDQGFSGENRESEEDSAQAE